MSEYEYLSRLDRGTASGIVRMDALSVGSILSDRQKQALYTQYCLGEKIDDLAASYGIGSSTAYRYIKQMRDKEGKKDMASRSKVVAGDKQNGRLTSTPDPHRFEGTCVIAGKKHSKSFTTINARKATELWEKWCQDLRDEQEFMDRVERKPKEKALVPVDEPPVDQLEDDAKVVCGYPGDPIEEIHSIQHDPEANARPWKEIAEERQRRIEELEKRISELEDKERKIGIVDRVASDTEGDTPKLGHWFNDNGAFRVFWMDKPVYVLWAKSESPKLYGVYHSMEAAIKEVDKLNEVASFLGSEGAFEVEEVQWKQS